MPNWDEPPSYVNSGFLKPGQLNIGTGTTPSLFEADNGTLLVAIVDNAYPKINVLPTPDQPEVRSAGPLCCKTL